MITQTETSSAMILRIAVPGIKSGDFSLEITDVSKSRDGSALKFEFDIDFDKVPDNIDIIHKSIDRINTPFRVAVGFPTNSANATVSVTNGIIEITIPAINERVTTLIPC